MVPGHEAASVGPENAAATGPEGRPHHGPENAAATGPEGRPHPGPENAAATGPEGRPHPGPENGRGLWVEDLSVSYGPVRALQGVSLRAEPGAVTAVLGANGAGKTTLLRAVSGSVRPRSGTVRLGPRLLTGMPVEQVVRSGVSYVPEGGSVIAELTVEENLRLGAAWRFGRRRSRQEMERIYALFPPLVASARRRASMLSGGERRMLALGRALVSRPTLLLLDEPSLGLAPMVTAQLMATLDDLTRATELTVVLVEQNARSALSIARHAVVLHLGTVVAAGPAGVVGADAALRHHYLGY